MAEDGYGYHPFRSTAAFFHNSNGANPGLLNLRPGHPLPPDLDLAFIPQPFTILSSSRGFILCRCLTNGSYHLFDPLYPPVVGHKRIPDPPNPHPADTPAVVIVRPERDYKIVCAVDAGVAGCRFDTFDSYYGIWTMDICSPPIRLLTNTGVSWVTRACWLIAAPPQGVVMYDADTSAPNYALPPQDFGQDARLQLGRIGERLGLVVVEDSSARVYRLIDVQTKVWELVCSVELQMLLGRNAAGVGSITNGHLSPMIVSRQIPQPLRFESFKVEVLFLVDGRLVLWESTDEDHMISRVVTAIQGPPANVLPIPLAFADGCAVPFVISDTIPPAGVWPSDQPEGFTRHWI